MFTKTLAAIGEVSAAAASAKQNIAVIGDTSGVFEGTLQEELDRFNEQIKAIPFLFDETEKVVRDRIENLSTIVNSGLYGENGVLAQASADRIEAYIDQQFADVRERLGFSGNVHNESFLTNDQATILGSRAGDLPPGLTPPGGS